MINKKKIKRYLSKPYAIQLIKTLSTDYWRLFPDINLNYEKRTFRVPEPTSVALKDNFQLFEIMGHVFYWPIEYASNRLKGLYQEIFAPIDINPHAYETKRNQITEGDWVLDAGACEGFFIHYALLRKANVLAVEPVPRLAEALRKTYHREICEGKVIILQAGIGNRTGLSMLQENKEEIYCSSISAVQGVEIPIISLDDILKQQIVPSINFIKMDIEGGEIEAFFDTRMVLESQPKLSIAVYHDYKNALNLRKIIVGFQPKYNISFRGLFINEKFGLPRPYMLHAR